MFQHMHTHHPPPAQNPNPNPARRGVTKFTPDAFRPAHPPYSTNANRTTGTTPWPTPWRWRATSPSSSSTSRRSCAGKTMNFVVFLVYFTYIWGIYAGYFRYTLGIFCLYLTSVQPPNNNIQLYSVGVTGGPQHMGEAEKALLERLQKTKGEVRAALADDFDIPQASFPVIF